MAPRPNTIVLGGSLLLLALHWKRRLQQGFSSQLLLVAKGLRTLPKGASHLDVGWTVMTAEESFDQRAPWILKTILNLGES
jgi:hypothetical protein